MPQGTTEDRLDQLEAQNRLLHTGVTGVLLAACLLLSAWNLFQAQSIPRFTEIFNQMLNGKSLPQASQFVIGAQSPLLILAIIFPLAAIAIFFILGRRSSGIWLLLALVFIVGLQALLTRFALWLPLYSMISEMSSG